MANSEITRNYSGGVRVWKTRIIGPGTVVTVNIKDLVVADNPARLIKNL